MEADTPLRGREAEEAQIEQELRARDRPGAVVVGPPGVGKTRLIRETATVWSDSGGQVVWVAGTSSGRQFPFGAFAGMAPALDAGDFASSAQRWIEKFDDTEDKLLLVDDAHLLDDASAALLHRLALSARRIGLVVTVCNTYLAPDAVKALAKDSMLHPVRLGPLSRDDVAEVSSDLLGGGDVEQATADRLFALSEGNPYVLRELVVAATADGVLAFRGHVWSWRGPMPISTGLGELMAARLMGTDPDVLRVLELLSLSEPMGFDDLAMIAGAPAVVAAEQNGLITADLRNDRLEVRCVHPLHPQLIHAGLGQVRKAELSGLLERALGRSGDSLTRAVLRLDSNEHRSDDAELFTEASRLARPDYVLAERLARAAVKRGGGFTALDYLVDALLWQGRVEEAKEVADTLGNDATPEEREYFVLRWSRMMWWLTGERPAVGSDTIGVLDEGQVTPAQLASAARQVAMTAASGRGAEVVGEALTLVAHPGADDETRCWAAGAAVLTLGGQGHVAEAQALVPDALDRARRLTDFNYLLLLSVLDIWLRRHCGDLEGAEAAIGILRHHSETADNPNPGVVALINADLVLARGEARRAVSLLRDAVAALETLDFAGFSALARARLGEALVLIGEPLTAADQLGAGAQQAERTLEMFRPEQMMATAWIHFGAGDRKRANLVLAGAARLAAEQGQPLIEVRVQHTLLRLGDLSAARRLLRIGPTVEGPFALNATRQARAALSGDLAGLVDAAVGFEEQGALLEATDAFASAAKVAQRVGDHPRGRHLAGRALVISERVGGLDTPALGTVAPEVPLTRRQRDVARLAASGLSSREIAARLGVGVRTVESHLEAVYRRLGLSGRAELSEYFRDR